ncbi:MAG TPA: NADH-ubiquinone dehydrogenase [Rhizobiaceae bacterium]|nr:NADH-ubiquinone dehydrogenase [Rhizobiaceae bacterium]
MSFFSVPGHLIPDVKQLERMNRNIHALLPEELASAVNMMAHPAAGLATASALGFGLAGHAFGVWMGAVAGVAEVSQRVFEQLERDVTPKTMKSGVRRSAPAPAEALVAMAPASAGPEELRQPEAVERPEQPDDLKKISGIGPKLEAALNGLGIWTYAQVAGWTPAEAAWIDDYLSFKGRIGRDGWIKQAQALSGTETKH